jgi:hypothetical protein
MVRLGWFTPSLDPDSRKAKIFRRSPLLTSVPNKGHSYTIPIIIENSVIDQKASKVKGNTAGFPGFSIQLSAFFSLKLREKSKK